MLGCTSKQQAVPVPKTKLSPKDNKPPKPLGLGSFSDTDLPIGTVGDFKYIVIQQSGDVMSDGHILGAQPDGMACFQNAQGEYILLRNQELGAARFLSKYGINDALFKGGKRPAGSYNDDMFGGVSRNVLDPLKLAADFEGPSGRKTTALSSSQYVLLGTDRNCAGGQFEDYWITCEESSEDNHGYAFLTHKDDKTLMKPRRIDTWGRLHREAVSVHKETGITYMTEDRRDGCLYRFVPVRKNDPFGAGVLQALKIEGLTTTHPYDKPEAGKVQPSAFKANQEWAVSWVDVADPQAKAQSCRAQAHAKGATIFNRGEGITQDESGTWFIPSLGGPVMGGQIFHLTHPDAKGQQRLRLAYEVEDRTQLSCPDNLVVAPWGDLVLAEDNYAAAPGVTTQHVRCMTRDGEIYPLLRVNKNGAEWKGVGPEFTGACFSPDGRYFFVNIQSPLNLTIAVKGPWPTT